ncbi:MAG TPA: BamA/TamA family outer membrane protein [Polyangiaceae bacterium]|nr:BamA/TamA family outer membrane protein [Polyangiaceae bacterium]
MLRRTFFICLTLAFVCTCFGAEAQAESVTLSTPRPPTPEPMIKDDYQTRRLEAAGFPLIAGNSDIGLEFGAVGTLTRFADGVIPYRWNADLVVALALKSGPNGTEITQQSYQWNIDVPSLANGRVRVNPQIQYCRTINQLYFGLGNASSGDAPPNAPPRYFQFDDRQARLRVLTRVALRAPVDLMIGTQYRFEDPHPYSGGRLEQDAAAGVVRGVAPLSLFTLAAGFVFDSRDNEVFPRSGGFHHLGLRGTLGAPHSERVGYGGVGAQAASYWPIIGPVSLALRGVVDLQFGNVPVYDLYTGGAFFTDEMIGGSSAVRGVPDGRYSGLIKVYGNAELRALLLRFRALDQQFRLGGNLLFDTGRLWSDYTFRSPLDGSGLGLKWGAGGGAYLVWGQAAVFRVEVAYSPDARSGNPGLPLGIYVEDGVMF